MDNIGWNSLVPELTVSDFSESLRFYTEGIGFEVLFSREDPGFAYLEFERSQLMIEEAHSSGWNVEELERPYGRGVNLQIECTNVRGLKDRLLSHDYLLSRDLEDEWYDRGGTLSGQRELLVQDPDGYLLRFSEPLGERPA